MNPHDPTDQRLPSRPIQDHGPEVGLGQPSTQTRTQSPGAQFEGASLQPQISLSLSPRADDFEQQQTQSETHISSPLVAPLDFTTPTEPPVMKKAAGGLEPQAMSGAGTALSPHFQSALQ